MGMKEAMKDFEENKITDMEKRIKELEKQNFELMNMVAMGIIIISNVSSETNYFEIDEMMNYAQGLLGVAVATNKQSDEIVATAEATISFLAKNKGK